ncbi:MAG: hypothetical protein JXA35_07030 [Deltaproteobacteria bacterium]|nr:hypothetical protein [Deltaproteobacteria bacterium]
MCLSIVLPHKFRTRLICMAFIVAFIPVTISALFMYVFLSRIPVEASRVVQRVQEEQLRRIEAEPESAEGFIKSVEFAREVSVPSSVYMVKAVDRLGTYFRNMVLLFSGLGMALSLALAFLTGRYFSRAFD